jgi:hypothetical protein
LACVPATLGNDVPEGGSTWQEAQFPTVSGDPAVWHAVQSGACESGEVPVTAWQALQVESNPACATAVCEVFRKGMEWLAWPGPFAWHPTEACSELALEAEKQDGAVLSGAVRPSV